MTIHELYWNAIHADQAFSQAISDETDGKLTRWTLKTMTPAIREAYDIKVAADQAYLTACTDARGNVV